MKHFAAAVFALVTSMLVLWQSGRAAAEYFGDLNHASPLSRTQPTLPAPPVTERSRRVILVVVDGLSESRSHDLPFIDALAGQGVRGVARAELPTMSRPNYVALMTGVPPVHSGVRGNGTDRVVELDSLFTRVRSAGMRSFVVTDDAPGMGVLFARDLDEATYAPWTGGFLRGARSAVGSGHDFVLLLPGAVDIAGHEHGGASVAYRRAALVVDGELRAALSGLDLRRDTVIVTSDHGHLPGGGHGGAEDDVVRVPLVMAGAGIKPDALIAGARLVDIAPTVAALLGIPAPGHGFGRTLVEALDVPEHAARALALADTRRLAANQSLVEASLARHSERTDALAARRGVLAVLGSVAAVLLLLIGRRTRAIGLDTGNLGAGVLVWALVVMALLVTGWPHVTLSELPNHRTTTLVLGVLAVVALVSHAACLWFALGEHTGPEHRLARVTGAVGSGLLLALVPALGAWAAWGGTPVHVLPGPEELLLLPGALVVCAAHAAGAIALLGVELVMYVARRTPHRPRATRLSSSRRAPRGAGGPSARWPA